MAGCYFKGEIKENDAELQPNIDELVKYVDRRCSERPSNADTNIFSIELEELHEPMAKACRRFITGWLHM